MSSLVKEWHVYCLISRPLSLHKTDTWVCSNFSLAPRLSPPKQSLGVRVLKFIVEKRFSGRLSVAILLRKKS